MSELGACHGEHCITCSDEGVPVIVVDVDRKTSKVAADDFGMMTYDLYNGWSTRSGHHGDAFQTVFTAAAVDVHEMERRPRDGRRRNDLGHRLDARARFHAAGDNAPERAFSIALKRRASAT